MNPTHEEQLFEPALEKPAAERAAFLTVVCGDDQALRERVEALLAAHEQQPAFLPKGKLTESVVMLLDESVLTERCGKCITRHKLWKISKRRRCHLRLCHPSSNSLPPGARTPVFLGRCPAM